MPKFETGATSAIVNDIVLTIINDGNGSQCGMTYQDRCKAADTGLWQYRHACRIYAPTATNKQIIEAASLIQEYYRDHTSCKH